MKNTPKIKSTDLSADALRLYPVWMESEDDDELYEPKARPEVILTDESNCIVAAEFFTLDDVRLQGCVYFDGADVPVIRIFIEGSDFIFNRRLPELAVADEVQLRTLLGRESQVFPVRFETQAMLEETGMLLSGVFHLRGPLPPVSREVWNSLRQPSSAGALELRRIIEAALSRNEVVYIQEPTGTLTRAR